MIDAVAAERTTGGHAKLDQVGVRGAISSAVHVAAAEPPSASALATEPQKVFSRAEYRYPALGDGKPGGGEPVTLLTLGGVPVSGCWQDDGRYVAWAPLPTRDRAKEQILRDMGKRI